MEDKFTTTIKGCKFTFTSKFFVTSDMPIVLLRSIDAGNKEKNLVFQRSRSECGMWRLAIIKPTDKFPNIYFEKGLNYTMSGFINIELQFFINSILDDLPVIDTFPEETCKSLFGTIGSTLNNASRMMEGGFIIDYIPKNSTITSIIPYSYQSLYSNPKPVGVHKLNPEKEQLDAYLALPKEKKLFLWPDKNADSIFHDSSIDFGETKIKIDGNIYSIEIESVGKPVVILYYLIYSCEIETPDEIHEYEEKPSESNPNPTYNFEKKIKIKNFIVPLYAIPKENHKFKSNQIDVSGYGLYNFYVTFGYIIEGPVYRNYKEFNFSKILEYVQYCKLEEYAPTCNTMYKFFGSFYNNMELFLKIKKSTFILKKAATALRKTRRARPSPRQRTTSRVRIAPETPAVPVPEPHAVPVPETPAVSVPAPHVAPVPEPHVAPVPEPHVAPVPEPTPDDAPPPLLGPRTRSLPRTRTRPIARSRSRSRPRSRSAPRSRPRSRSAPRPEPEQEPRSRTRTRSRSRSRSRS